MKSRSPRLLVFLTVFIDLLGFGIVLPISSAIAKRYAIEGPLYEMQVGLLMASYSLCQMIFAPMWGRLSDRVGRRPILLLSLFGSVVSYTLFGLATNYWMLLAGRTFAGICAANITVAQAYIADVTPPEKRTSAMGLIGMAFGLGFAIGPVFGAIMVWAGSRLAPDRPEQLFPGLAAGAICLLNLLWAIAALPESLSPELRGKVESERRLASTSEFMRSLRHPVIGPLIGVFFLATLGFSNLEVALGLYINDPAGLDMPLNRVYHLFIFVGLLLAFMHGYVVRKLVKFIPEAVLVIIGVFAQAVGLIMLPLFASIWWIALAMVFVAFGQGICVPSLLALVSQATSATRQGSVMGVTQSASSLARIIGPIFAVAVWKVAGLQSPFVAGGLVMLGAVAMAVVTRRRLIHAPLDLASPAP